VIERVSQAQRRQIPIVVPGSAVQLQPVGHTPSAHKRVQYPALSQSPLAHCEAALHTPPIGVFPARTQNV
jgi:hypothetical protein